MLKIPVFVCVVTKTPLPTKEKEEEQTHHLYSGELMYKHKPQRNIGEEFIQKQM